MSLPGLTEYPRVSPEVLANFMKRYRLSLQSAYFTFYGDSESVEDALAEYRKDGLVDSDFSSFMANQLTPYYGEKAA